MGRLEAQHSPAFVRDAKRLRKKHVDDTALAGVIDLIVRNTPEALERLRRRHRMHTLAGNWTGSNERHIANTGILVTHLSGIRRQRATSRMATRQRAR